MIHFSVKRNHGIKSESVWVSNHNYWRILQNRENWKNTVWCEHLWLLCLKFTATCQVRFTLHWTNWMLMILIIFRHTHPEVAVRLRNSFFYLIVFIYFLLLEVVEYLRFQNPVHYVYSDLKMIVHHKNHQMQKHLSRYQNLENTNCGIEGQMIIFRIILPL